MNLPSLARTAVFLALAFGAATPMPKNEWHKEDRDWGYFIWQRNEGLHTLRIMAEMGIRQPRGGGLAVGTNFSVPLKTPVKAKAMHGNVSYTAWCEHASSLMEINTPDGEYLDSVKLGATHKEENVVLSRSAEYPSGVDIRSLDFGVYDDLCKPVTWSWDVIFTW